MAGHRSGVTVTHGRYIPGTDPMVPQPYSAAQVADLVARTRIGMVAAAEMSSGMGWAR